MPELGWLIEKEIVPKLGRIDEYLESIDKSLKLLSDPHQPSYIADALESIAKSLEIRFPSPSYFYQSATESVTDVTKPKRRRKK